MSKYIDDIIADIKANPTTWKDYRGFGISKDNTEIWGYGNTAILSTIRVRHNKSSLPTTWLDTYKLEKAVKNWYKTISFNHLTK